MVLTYATQGKLRLLLEDQMSVFHELPPKDMRDCDTSGLAGDTPQPPWRLRVARLSVINPEISPLAWPRWVHMYLVSSDH